MVLFNTLSRNGANAKPNAPEIAKVHPLGSKIDDQHPPHKSGHVGCGTSRLGEGQDTSLVAALGL